MASSVRGFSYRDLTQHAKAELGRRVVNFAKALPATTTGNLFTVTGSVVVTGFFGVVSTITQAIAMKPSFGVTGSVAAIAAVPAVGWNALAVGSVVIMPPAAGGALPVPIAASSESAAASLFVVTAAAITITTDATVTGNITWVLEYVPLMPKAGASVAAA